MRTELQAAELDAAQEIQTTITHTHGKYPESLYEILRSGDVGMRFSGRRTGQV